MLLVVPIVPLAQEIVNVPCVPIVRYSRMAIVLLVAQLVATTRTVCVCHVTLLVPHAPVTRYVNHAQVASCWLCSSVSLHAKMDTSNLVPTAFTVTLIVPHVPAWRCALHANPTLCSRVVYVKHHARLAISTNWDHVSSVSLHAQPASPTLNAQHVMQDTSSKVVPV